ncbi:MAG: guanylate kinase [Candidatus Omnitrophica bacterium]|nr:guanylate kinase [Candidatus Omnitrophota bacterium]
MSLKGKIIIVSGPSGSGKTTLAGRLLRSRRLRRHLVKSVSYTTRPPRSGERDGRDYFFVPLSEFNRLRRNKKILEWTKYLGYYYATSRDFVEQVLAGGKHVVLCLDYRGVVQLKRAFPRQVCSIFIIPPSLEELRARISSRCRRTGATEIQERLLMAKKELDVARKYDYRIVNKTLSTADRQLKELVFKIIRGRS